MIDVYLDSDERREHPLHAVRIDGPWNGWVIPVATAVEFRRFIAEFIAADQFWSADVHEFNNRLFYSDEAGNEEIFYWAGVHVDGTALYSFGGWTWTT